MGELGAVAVPACVEWHWKYNRSLKTSTLIITKIALMGSAVLRCVWCVKTKGTQAPGFLGRQRCLGTGGSGPVPNQAVRGKSYCARCGRCKKGYYTQLQKTDRATRLSLLLPRISLS